MRIIIVDDDPLVCQSLKMIIEMGSERDKRENVEVVAIGHDGTEAIEFYDREKPDIILLDIRMEEMDGLTAGRKILEKHLDAKLLYLTTFLDGDYIIEALKIGASGYLMKSSFENILSAIYAVKDGQRVFGDEIVEKLPGMMKEQKRKRIELLTEREMSIVEQVAEGYNNKEISEKLYLSEGTVRNYISMVLDKLELRDRTQLAIFYYKEKE